MKRKKLSWIRPVLPSLTIAANFMLSNLIAQEDEANVIELSPFVVSSEGDSRYNARETTSGTLIRTPVQDLPFSITSLTQDLIKDSFSQTVEDVVRFSAGVTNAGRSSFQNTGLSIRGYRTDLLLRNGVRYNFWTNSVNIERVEVIKGSSSILFGQSDPGGSVNYITKRHVSSRFVDVSQQVGSYNYFKTDLDANLPLDKDGKVLFRLMGSYINKDKSLDHFHYEETFLNPVFKFVLSPKTELVVDTLVRDQGGIVNREPMPFVNGFGSETQHGLVPLEFLYKGADYSNLNPNDSFDSDTFAFESTLNHRFSQDSALQFLVAYSDVETDQLSQYSHQARTSESPFLLRRFSGTEVGDHRQKVIYLNYTKELDLGSTNHRIVAGYQWTHNGDSTIRKRPLDENGGVRWNPLFDPANPDDPNLLAFVPREEFDSPRLVEGVDFGYWPNNFFEWNPSDYSFFLTDQITALENKLVILGGIRYQTLNQTDQTETTPQIGITYKLDEDVSLYASKSSSFQPNSRSDNRDPNSAFLPPEEGEGIEAGIKFNLFGDKMIGSLSAFEIKRRNIVAIDGAAIFTGENGVRLAGEQTSEGFELGFSFAPTTALDLNFSYAYTDARTTSDLINANTPDANGDGIADSIGLENENVARNSVSILSSYRLNDNWRVGGSFMWQEGPFNQFGTYNRRFVTEESDRTRLDLFASYNTEWRDRDVEYRLNITNATNERHLLFRAEFNDPVQAFLTASFSFD